jgi:ABC-type Fe3+-hydroxamate transport system substrate-binding protein
MSAHCIMLCLGLLVSSDANPAFAAPVKESNPRLASFAPSNTELIYAIGGADKLIGVCSYCDYPSSVKQKKIVGNFISANLERLAGLKPDKIVLVSGQETLAGLLAHNGYKVTVFRNDHLADISKNLRGLALLTGNTTRGEQAASTFDKCIADLKTITGAAKKRSVFHCVWPQPLLTIGSASYLTEAITVCGGESISNKLEAGYPHYSLEKLVLANPDLIVMPFECKDHGFLKQHPWSTLQAVKNDQVYFLPEPTQDGLSRPTLRMINGLHWLAKRIHPELAPQLDAWFARSQSSLIAYQGSSSPARAADNNHRASTFPARAADNKHRASR